MSDNSFLGGMRIENIGDITPDVAAAVFATEYDETIKEILQVMRALGLTDAEFHAILDEDKKLLQATSTIPKSTTVAESMKYVYVSDLLTLGHLCHIFFTSQAERFVMRVGELDVDSDD
jgi:hypothetical protein